ncbi:MAG: hypothetical protein ACYC25_06310 [Paludibacter sp.]
MKKTSLFLGMVLAASMALAQNTAVTSQTGDDNGATVNQTGDDNGATINQVGNLDVGTVSQDGTSNVGLVDQINGGDNTGTINQTGGSNEAYLTQGMVENYYDAPYDKSSAVPANGNTGSIIQNGSGNVTEFVQVGTNNEGSVTQNATGNTAYAYQGWAFGFWGETATTSALPSTNSDVTISQISGDNYGAVWQYGGDNNSIEISQTVGGGNSAQIAQGFIYADANYDFTHPVYNVDDNTAVVSQAGDGNSAKLFQLGNGNSFNLTQNGSGNTLGGRGLSGLEAGRNGYFEQDGDGNIFEGTQSDGATLDYTSRQTGDGNYINLSQGEDDLAKVIQQGDLNNVYLTQMGGGQNATILQTGDSNTATVTQQ